jgi:hypothetical protein
MTLGDEMGEISFSVNLSVSDKMDKESFWADLSVSDKMDKRDVQIVQIDTR